MQIFVLSYDIKRNVSYYCDKHVNKQLTEACQLLSTWYRFYVGDRGTLNFIYKSTHFNHPISKWMREDINNVKYVVDIAFALYQEYQYRYNKPDKHKRNIKIIKFIHFELEGYNYSFPKSFVKCFKNKCPDLMDNSINVVEAYREYYNRFKLTWTSKKTGKVYNNKWTKRRKPSWIK